jgi:hypothetical protein
VEVAHLVHFPGVGRHLQPLFGQGEGFGRVAERVVHFGEPPEDLRRHVPLGSAAPGLPKTVVEVHQSLVPLPPGHHEFAQVFVGQRRFASEASLGGQGLGPQEAPLRLPVGSHLDQHPALHQEGPGEVELLAEPFGQLGGALECAEGVVELAELGVNHARVVLDQDQVPGESQRLGQLQRLRQIGERLLPPAGVLLEESEVVVDVGHTHPVLDPPVGGQGVHQELLRFTGQTETDVAVGDQQLNLGDVPMVAGVLQTPIGLETQFQGFLVMAAFQEHEGSAGLPPPQILSVHLFRQVDPRPLQAPLRLVQAALETVAIGHPQAETEPVGIVRGLGFRKRLAEILQGGGVVFRREVHLPHLFDGRDEGPLFRTAAAGFLEWFAFVPCVVHGLPHRRWGTDELSRAT